MKDRAMQALYLLALEPISETLADQHSYGFRPQRSTHDAIHQCFILLSKRRSFQWILEADIKGCFDNIDHKWLLDHIPIDRTILSKWLKAGFWEKGSLFPTEKGTPQGGIASPNLANMTLDGLEKEIANLNKKRKKAIFHFVRYADDFIVVGKDKDLLESEAKPAIEKFLKERGLTLSEEKTRITHIDQGFDFLGMNLRKYKGKLLTKPSKKNVKSFLQKVRNTIRKMRTATQEQLIGVLNPILRGWANSNSRVVAKATFSRTENEIWRALWRWAKRRHPNKGARWIKNKYFKQIGSRSGWFACKTEKGRMYRLYDLAGTPIRRHVKIRKAANPFDSKDELYFESRNHWKMRRNLVQKKKLLSIWKNQNGRCPHCQQLFGQDAPYDTHHIIPRCEGGKDNVANLVLLHPNCHKQIHNPLWKKLHTGSR